MTRRRPTSARPVLALLMAGPLVLSGCADPADPAGAAGTRGPLLLATTTSTRDSGLLDELVPSFTRASGCEVKTLAVGSGEALALGERGDADVLLVHSPKAEQELVDAGRTLSREAVMHNDYVLLGPPDDPAGLRDAPDTPQALARLAGAGAPFVSRGDDSGTHAKELSLWKAAGIDPAGQKWYSETGQGMGATLTVADQRRAYVLADRGTFLATQNLESVVLAEGDAGLRNDYHVLVVAGAQQVDCAEDFSAFLLTEPTQEAIGAFGVEKFGQPLFFPDAAG